MNKFSIALYFILAFFAQCSFAEDNLWFGDEELEWRSHHPDVWCKRYPQECQAQDQQRMDRETWCEKYPEKCNEDHQEEPLRDHR